MNCQMFSTGLSSGDFGGRGKMVMLGGMRNLRRHVPACLIDEEDGVGARRDDLGDLGEM